MQVLAPASANVSVTEPAVHGAHAIVDSDEYCPTAHDVQTVAALLTAPVPAPFSAMEPAPHSLHAVVGMDENWPAVHGSQEVAPVLSLVTEPASQSMQLG